MSYAASTTIADAQREMRFAYYGGAPGMLASATAWAAAAGTALQGAPERAVWVLFVGGMLIHPVSVLLVKALGRPARHSPGNPLAALAMATTVWLILSCALAYGVAQLHLAWFFPAMLFVIGGRYLCFATMFGDRTYWVCGAALVLAGYLLGRADAAPAISASAGAAIEAAFAIAILVAARREARG